MYMEVKWYFRGMRSLFSSCGFWESDSGHQVGGKSPDQLTHFTDHLWDSFDSFLHGSGAHFDDTCLENYVSILMACVSTRNIALNRQIQLYVLINLTSKLSQRKDCDSKLHIPLGYVQVHCPWARDIFA